MEQCGGRVCLSLLIYNNGVFCSPMLRMSFIVFSTQGKIVMKLTEDR